MPGETISCHFVLILASLIMDDITCIMNSFWIDSLFTLELKPSAASRVSLIYTVPGLAMKNCSSLSNVEHEQPYQILAISLTFVVCLLLQMNTVGKHHGKSKTRASANQTHPA